MKFGVKFPRAAVWPTPILIILLLIWMWWGLARLLSGGWIDHKITELRYGGRPAKHTAFPPIRELSSLKIVLERDCLNQPCAGAYKAQIEGSGEVHFEGGPQVAIPGSHFARLDPGSVQSLYQAFRQADFFWLRPRYQGPALTGEGVRQPPVWRLGLAYDGRPVRWVSDFRGEAIGMPEAVNVLEQAVYRQTGLARWVEGDATTIPSLIAEGWDLKADTPQNGALIVGSARARNTALVRDLIAAGAPIHGVYGCRALTVSAFGRQYKPVFEMLRAAGAPVRSGDCAVPDKWPGAGSERR